MNFTHLNVKSHYSFMNSLLKVEDIVNYAVSSNFKCVALCDINNTYGLLELYYKSGDLKPLLGIELRFNNDSYILYAKNYDGLKNIFRLSSLVVEDSLDFSLFSSMCNDLICVLNVESKATNDFKVGDFNSIKELKNMFEDIYYISTYDLEYEIEFVKTFDLKALYSNCVKYALKTDKKYFDLLKAIEKNNKYIKDISESKHHFLDVANINNTFIENTESIINACNVEIPNQVLIPKFCDNSYEYLEKLCIAGLKKRLGNNTDNVEIYLSRLKYELSVINDMNFSDYFLIVYDYVKYAKSKGIVVGPGRGSAAGSLISYVLGITGIDPIEYNLLFERFLNPERITFPDIDIDFEDLRRDEIVEYIIDKYGVEYVGLISTFSTFASRQAIRDVAKAMGRNNVDIKNLTDTISPLDSLKKNYKENIKFRNLIDKSPENELVYKNALKLEGIIKHLSKHAAGIVLSSTPLNEVIGVIKSGGQSVVQSSMDYLESLGLIKMDLLGLRNLTIIKNIVKDIKEELGIDFDISKVDLNDESVFEIFSNGNTLGLFQYESAGMRNVLQKLKPDKFLDLVACNALHRPGPMENIDEFVLRKHNKAFDYIHDDLKDVLSETYGIIVYQEQIMQIARIIAGYSFAKADILRRAMSKKDLIKLSSMQDDFVKQGVENGYDLSLVSEIYEYILKFANYGFNKAHAVSYSYIGYVMGYLKVHYPHYFMCELLNNAIGNSKKVFEYINECRLLGIKIMAIDVNTSTDRFYVSEGVIYMPFTIVKGITSIVSNKIVDERILRNYENLYDFINRLALHGISENNISALIYVNAFKSIEKLSISTQISSISDIIEGVEIHKYFNDDFLYQEQEEYDTHFLISKEREYLGFNFSKHPTAMYPDFLTVNTLNMKDYVHKRVKVLMYIESVKEIVTKKGDTMAFLKCSDLYGEIECVAFASVYNPAGLKKGNLMYAYVKVESRNGKVQLNINSYKIKEW